MSEKKSKLISFISFGASILIAFQILIIKFQGEAACLNEGCKVVESLTTISPFYFNLIGFLYFQTVFWIFYLARKKPPWQIDLPGLILLAGIVVEGVLLAYQIYIAKALCSYCIFIFAIVLVLNFLAGRPQIITGVACLAGIIFISSLLSYGPTALLSKQQTINTGTYGIRTCLDPAKELYLFFSAKCPHCKNVIKALEGCNSCNFHFNPIEKLRDFKLNGIERTASYDPELNKLLLKLLGIKSIPVLLEKNASGFTIIKGEKQIVRYIEQACYRAEPLLYFESTEQSKPDHMSVYGEEGECSMTIECDESAQ